MDATSMWGRGSVPALRSSRGEAAAEHSSACTRRTFERGQSIFGVGDAFRLLCIVDVGAFKSVAVSDDGLAQVSGFPMKGDVLGLDGIFTGFHRSEVVALERCEVFELPYARCEAWMRGSEYARMAVVRALAQELARCHAHALMLGTMHAEQRTAIFLLGLSERYRRLGYSPSMFVLRMSRKDIGSYLGIKLETVSRSLARLREQGLIGVCGKAIRLLDLPRLLRIGGVEASARQPAFEPFVDRHGQLLDRDAPASSDDDYAWDFVTASGARGDDAAQADRP